MAAAKKDVTRAPEQVDTVALPAPPDGFRYVLMRGDHCLAQTCPMHLDDQLAYSKSPGYGDGEPV